MMLTFYSNGFWCVCSATFSWEQELASQQCNTEHYKWQQKARDFLNCAESNICRWLVVNKLKAFGPCTKATVFLEVVPGTTPGLNLLHICCPSSAALSIMDINNDVWLLSVSPVEMRPCRRLLDWWVCSYSYGRGKITIMGSNLKVKADVKPEIEILVAKKLSIVKGKK